MGIGFVILSHRNPGQVERLVSRLRWDYGEPEIVVHHDVTKSAAPRLPAGVKVVDPVRTSWGDWSLTEAALRGLRATESDWVVMMSGQDYPIVPAHVVRTALRDCDVDAHLELREVLTGTPGPWHNARVDRYFGHGLWLGRLPTGRMWGGGATARLPVRRTSYVAGLRCYAGSQWFVANRVAVDVILRGEDEFPQLAKRYRRRFAPEESYVHTLLGNSGVRVDRGQWYISWAAGRPRTLTTADLPTMLGTGRWFARKFDVDVDARVLDRLDEIAKG